MTNVGIIDYGVGNLRSLSGAIEACGATAIVTSQPHALGECHCLILPGVGAFGDGIAELRKRGLVDTLNSEVKQRNKPILGVCLGAQLMASHGYEFGDHNGLDWVSGKVIRIVPASPAIRLPHVGWNQLITRKPCALFNDIPDDALFYFVHSFHIDLENCENVKAEAEYGMQFTAAFQSENVYGVQFHPEKSQRHGLQILKNFITIAEKD